ATTASPSIPRPARANGSWRAARQAPLNNIHDDSAALQEHAMATNQFYVGTDIGGTFTDVVISDSTGERTLNAKTLTTPADPVQGVMNGVREALESAGARPEEVRRLVHATTLPTNLVIERKGGRVVYVTTQGFGDMFLIGKEQRSPEVIFDLNYRRP